MTAAAASPSPSGPKPLALVAGVGRGTGQALVRRFAAGGYRVAMVARKASRLEELAAAVPDSSAWPADVAELEGWRRTLRRIRDELGVPRVAIYNAAAAVREPFEAIDPLAFERAFRVNTTALLVLAQELCPAMVAGDGGALIVTGNTGSWRGKPHFTGFAPTKAAQRILAEALARQLGPQGVHVAYVVIDAKIDIWWVRERAVRDLPDEAFARPDDIAAECFHIAHQPRSTWSFNVEIRPFGEPW